MKLIFNFPLSASAQRFRSLAFICQIVLMLFSSSGLKAQDNGVPIIVPSIGLEPGIKGEFDCENLPECVKDLENLVCLIGNTTGVNILTSGSNPKLLPMPQAATTPQNVVISTNLVVDIDYTFAPGSTIVVLEQVAIKVNAGVTFSILDNSIVRGCEKMWQGIQVDLGGFLDLQGVTLEDAGIGVHMKPDGNPQISSKITVENCTFNLCLTSIALGNTSGSFSNATTSRNIITKINNNYFSGLGPLKTNPTGFTAPLIGIHMNSILPVVILNNTFENYGLTVDVLNPRRGIQVFNSSPSLVYNTFNNIGSGFINADFTSRSKCIQFENPPTKQIRILQGGASNIGYFLFSTRFGHVSCTGTTISNCVAGIFLTQAVNDDILGNISITANGNSISNYIDAGIHVAFGIGQVVSNVQMGGNTFIDDNIQCFTTKVKFRGAIMLLSPIPKTINSNISNNTVTNSAKSFCNKYLDYGISLEKCNNGAISSNTLVDNNNIAPGDQNKFNAISLNLSNDIIVQENTITGQAGVIIH